MDVEDAILFIVEALRSGDRNKHAGYGYDVYARTIAYSYLRVQGQEEEREAPLGKQAVSVFMNAGWELCRRGILRPGVRNFDAQPTPDGSAGCGFTITPFGKKWLGEPVAQTFLPTEPERFARLLEPYRRRFGDGFHQRAQEAMRCYVAHAYLACCSMCGAAAESILLAAAIARSSDPDQVMKTYRSASGRSRVENIVFGQAPDRLKREASGLSGLLKYWRDASAHGSTINVSDDEAFASIASLLRYASIVEREWKELTDGSV